MANEQIQPKPEFVSPSRPGASDPGSPESSNAEGGGLSALPTPVRNLVRWAIVLVVVIGLGWGIALGVGYALGRAFPGDPNLLMYQVIGGLVPLTASVFLFARLERNHWLTHAVGLPETPLAHPVARGVIWAALGPPIVAWYALFHPKRGPETAAPAGYSAAADSATREVVETIVFVVVLVLLLKSFVAEAFVIPTGSMATTLWGYQKYVECPKCKHSFPVNCSSEVDPSDGFPVAVTDCVCPNCRWHIKDLTQDVQREARDPHTGQRGTVTESRPRPGFEPITGDRVLVAKFLYDLPWKTPQRLDVVVFKYPKEPQRKYVPMNYIKRLIGLGGETIAIHDGNIYFLDPKFGLKYEEVGVNPKDLWDEHYMHRDDLSALELFAQGQFQIIRKKPKQMISMSRLVFDHDHPPLDLPNEVRWVAADGDEGWAPIKEEHGFRLANTAPTGKPAWLSYRHLIRGNNGKPALVTDIMGYNMGFNTSRIHKVEDRPPDSTQHWVGDLMLDTEVTLDKAQGHLVLELSRGVDRFRAIWDLNTGLCTLRRLDADALQKPDDLDAGEKIAESQPTPLRASGTFRVRFANYDDRLTVWVGSELPFGDGVVYTPAKTPGPRPNDLQPASLAAQGTGVSVRKLKLWRDTYYTPPKSTGLQVDWTNPKAWEDLWKLPPRTLYVQPGHYLCMGDNSPQSSDSRDWGTVPQRLMLGRALGVYYPFAFPWWPLNAPVNRVGAIE